MRCVACFKEGTKKDFLFDENKNVYCVNPFTCNENHPNSVKNIIARGAAVKMFTEEELELNFFEINGVSDEVKERVLKVATKPQSIRLSKFDIAHYLLQLQDLRGLASISEAVRYCVMYTKRNMPIDASDEGLIVPDEESSDETVPDVPVSEGIKFVVPEITKSVNVDWNNLPKMEPVPAPADDEEDEF